MRTTELSGASPLARLAALGRERGASWVCATPGRPLMLRIDGVPTAAEELSADEIDAIFDAVRKERPREVAERDRVGWMHATFNDDGGIYEVTLAEDRSGKRVILTMGRGRIENLDDLELSSFASFVDAPAGLILIGGVGHCGRQRVVHALLRAALRGRRSLGVSVERARTVEHERDVWQIDVGEYGRVRHVATFAEAVRLAKAIGADVLALSELPDPETVDEALSAIERDGMLVIARVFGRTVGEMVTSLGRSLRDIERVVDGFAAGVSLRSYFDMEGHRRFVAERVIPSHLLRTAMKKGETDLRSFYPTTCRALEDDLRAAMGHGFLTRDAAYTLAAFPDAL